MASGVEVGGGPWRPSLHDTGLDSIRPHDGLASHSARVRWEGGNGEDSAVAVSYRRDRLG